MSWLGPYRVVAAPLDANLVVPSPMLVRPKKMGSQQRRHLLPIALLLLTKLVPDLLVRQDLGSIGVRYLDEVM